MSTYNFDYNQYKKRLNTKSKLPISLCIVLIIILTGIVCFINKKTDYVEFYFVEVGNFFKYSQASSLAQELQQKNAAGYVYFDGSYHVLACAYLNEDDAKSVVDTLKNEYQNATVFTLSTNEFKYNFSSKENDAIEKVICANETVINDLYNNIMEYDKNNIELDKLELNLKSMLKTYSTGTDDFSTVFKTNKNMTTAKENISTIKGCITETNESWKLKYNLIKIAISHYSFLEFLS